MSELRLAAFASLALLVGAACSSGDDSGDAGGGGAAGSAGGDSGTVCLAGGVMTVAIEPNPSTGLPYDWGRTGSVTSSTTNSFVIDECPPNSGCNPTLTTLTLEPATAIGLQVPIGAFVEVHLAKSIYCPYCGEVATLSVRNVATWSGVTNPVSGGDTWYLLFSEGSLTSSEAPFAVSSTAASCVPGDPGKLYRLVFSDPGGASVELPQSEKTAANLGGRTWTLKNVRSFEYGGYDGPAPYAWWAIETAK